jgi:flagellar hook-basal body complex protein FliE
MTNGVIDINGLTSGNINALTTSKPTETVNGEAFESLLSSAMDMVNETNTLASNAQQEEINFSLGKSDNTHDLSVALQKASLSLQYTVAVKNAVLDAYKEIMNIQI